MHKNNALLIIKQNSSGKVLSNSPNLYGSILCELKPRSLLLFHNSMEELIMTHNISICKRSTEPEDQKKRFPINQSIHA